MVRYFGAGCAAIALVSAAPAFAVEIVTNGGFETGNFSGYTLSGSGSGGVFANFPGLPPELERFRAAFIGAPVTLSQTLSTVAGQTYNFGFTHQVDPGGTSNSFLASFGGAPVLSQSNILTGMNFTTRNFTVVANSSSTQIAFTFASQGGFQNFDNVTVQAVPEPATWALMLFGFGAAGYSLRRAKVNRRLRYA